MADATDDVRADLAKQIADLKKETTKISKLLASRASDVMDDAEEIPEDGKSRARHTVAQVRGQAHVAVGAMRDHPGTTTVLVTLGLVGLTAGLFLRGVLSGNRLR